jgi:hypothetical protein
MTDVLKLRRERAVIRGTPEMASRFSRSIAHLIGDNTQQAVNSRSLSTAMKQFRASNPSERRACWQLSIISIV